MIEEGMDQLMGKVGGYWFSQKANAEMNGAGDDINVRKSHPHLPKIFCRFR